MIVIEPPRSKTSGAGSAIPRRELSRFLASAVRAVGLTGEVSLLLTGDERIRRLNREFRGQDKTTDVLSFPAAPETAGGAAGDLAISLDRASRQAADCGHTLAAELKVLTLHGLLHLAGYDHEKDEGEMARQENRLRREFGLPLGLIQRNRTPEKPAAASVPRGQGVGAGKPPLPGRPRRLRQ